MPLKTQHQEDAALGQLFIDAATDPKQILFQVFAHDMFLTTATGMEGGLSAAQLSAEYDLAYASLQDALPGVDCSAFRDAVVALCSTVIKDRLTSDEIISRFDTLLLEFSGTI